jgi:hypothetical protein
MYNTTNCSTLAGNTGAQNYCGPVGIDRILVLVPKGTEIATETLAVTLSTWQDNINEAKGNRWYPLIPIWEMDPNQADPTTRESSLGYEEYVRDGKLKVKYTLDEMSPHNKTQLAKLNGQGFDLWVITDKEYIKGRSVDGAKFLPYQLDYFRVLPETPNTGSENAHVAVELKFTDVREMNEFYAHVNPSISTLAPTAWYPTIELVGIKDLVIDVTTMSDDEATIVLKGYDNVPYSGAVKEDLYMRKTSSTGAAITISALTETATPGTYTATFAAQSNGVFYFSLYDQPDATTQFVETPVVDTYTLSS